MSIKPKSGSESPPKGGALTPRDQTWRHYSAVMESFRKLCHGDKELFRQAEAKIRAKRVTEAWESEGRPFLNVDALSKRMTDAVLDIEDERQIDVLYRRKLAFRDRVTNSLGKLPEDGWDVFYDRRSSSKAVPHTVKMFEMGAA